MTDSFGSGQNPFGGQTGDMFFGHSGVFGAGGREGSGDMAVSEPGFSAMGVPEVDGWSLEVEVVKLLQQRMV